MPGPSAKTPTRHKGVARRDCGDISASLSDASLHGHPRRTATYPCAARLGTAGLFLPAFACVWTASSASPPLVQRRVGVLNAASGIPPSLPARDVHEALRSLLATAGAGQRGSSEGLATPPPPLRHTACSASAATAASSSSQQRQSSRASLPEAASAAVAVESRLPCGSSSSSSRVEHPSPLTSSSKNTSGSDRRIMHPSSSSSRRSSGCRVAPARR